MCEGGVRFQSYTDGSERFMGPETSMEVQAKLGSDIALAFDECTPFHADRTYTLRAMERTHRWLDRCIAWHGDHAPSGQLLYGIVQGGVHEDLRAESTAYVAAAEVDGIVHAVAAGVDSFDCATPTRLARHGTALVPDPGRRAVTGEPRGRRAVEA